jgi:hypothetical protein
MEKRTDKKKAQAQRCNGTVMPALPRTAAGWPPGFIRLKQSPAGGYPVKNGTAAKLY